MLAMNLIDKYIAKTILGTTVLVLCVLLGVQSFVQLAAQLQDVGKGNYSWLQAFLFVPLMLPSDVYQLFPMAALLGSLMGLSRLSNSSELMVIRTSGMSLFQIAKAVLVAAIVMLFFVTIVGEILGPLSRDFALNIKTNALSEGRMLHTRSGVWMRDHNNFIHISKIKNRHDISGVTLYQLNTKHRLNKLAYAQSATLQEKEWLFNNVDETLFHEDHIEKNHYQQQRWGIHLNTRLMVLSEVDPHQQSLNKLYKYLKFRKHSGQGRGLYEYVFWQRVFQPLATIVMILLSIPFVFGPLQRSSNGLRLIMGIMMGFGFFIMNKFFGPISQVYQIPPAIASIMPAFVFAMIGGYLIKFRS